jgi:large subunit ribosomal protein L1
MVDRVQILDAVKAAMEAAPERKFQESIEISVNLRNIDMSQPKKPY